MLHPFKIKIKYIIFTILDIRLFSVLTYIYLLRDKLNSLEPEKISNEVILSRLFSIK